MNFAPETFGGGFTQNISVTLTAQRAFRAPSGVVPSRVFIQIDYINPTWDPTVMVALGAENGVLYAVGDRVGGGEPAASYLIALGDIQAGQP